MPLSTFLGAAARPRQVTVRRGQERPGLLQMLTGGGSSDPRQEFMENIMRPFFEGIKTADTPEKVKEFAEKNYPTVLAEGLKAGANPEKLAKLNEVLLGPALQNLQRQEIGNVIQENSPRSEPRPEGVEGPAMESGAFLERPRQNATQEQMFRIGKYGPFPQGLSAALQVPSQVEHYEAQTGQQRASQAKAQEDYEKAATARRRIASLPEQQIEGAAPGMTTRGFMEMGGTATQLVPQREMSGTAQAIKNQELAIRQQNLEALNQRREFLNQLGTANMATAEHRLELQRLNTEIRQMELELKKQGTDVETQWAPNVLNDEATRFKVAQEAPKGATDKQLKEIFAARGYDVEGNLKIVPGGWLGDNRIEGITAMQRKPKTTSTRPGGAAPAGQATTPAPAASPNRLRFDSQGNLIK